MVSIRFGLRALLLLMAVGTTLPTLTALTVPKHPATQEAEEEKVAEVAEAADEAEPTPLEILAQEAEGMDADLLVLDKEFAVQQLMVGGRWHIHNGQQQVWGSFETDPQEAVS